MNAHGDGQGTPRVAKVAIAEKWRKNQVRQGSQERNSRMSRLLLWSEVTTILRGPETKKQKVLTTISINSTKLRENLERRQSRRESNQLDHEFKKWNERRRVTTGE